jgi:hypothetical protein
MFGKNRNKKVGLCVMVVTASLILAAVWAVLATPETALAKKPDNPGGGGEPEVLHGTATFRDDLNEPDDPLDPFDRVLSDGDSYTYTGSGKGGAILLGLGDFFRLKVQVDKKGVGRRFVLDFDGLLRSDGVTPLDPGFSPENPYVWSLNVQGTLAEWRAQEIGTEVLREGNLYFGSAKGWDHAHVSYGKWGGSYLTVTRTDVDVWTIESLPGDEAVFYRQDLGEFGTGPMLFQVTYEGQ